MIIKILEMGDLNTDLVERTPDIIAKIKALFVKEDLSDALLEDDE